MVDKGDGNFWIRIVSVVNDVGNIVIIRSECFEDVVVIIEIEGDSVSQCFSP